MLLMVEKGIIDRIFQAIHRHAKANNKYMKNYNKDIISLYLMYLDANNLYGWEISQKLPMNGFKWVKNLSECNSIQFNEITMKIVTWDIFPKIIRKNYLIFIKIYPFYLKEIK